MEKINYNSEDLENHHGVSIIIKNDSGEILMQKHVKYGFWTIPVGKVRNNQSVEEGLKEEVLEECGIIPNKFKEILTRDDIYERNGKNVKVTSHLIEVLDYSGEIENKEPEKHSEQIFMSVDKIMKLDYLSDLTIAYLEILGFKRENYLKE